MHCQVVTNSECSNYKHYFQSEIAQFPRMRSLWLEKKHDRSGRQSSLCKVCLFPPVRVCVNAVTRVHECKQIHLPLFAHAGRLASVAHSMADALDKSRNGSCQPPQHLAPQLSPFTACCKPHQAAVATQWWAWCGAPSLGEQFEAFVLLCVIISANQGLLIY